MQTLICNGWNNIPSLLRYETARDALEEHCCRSSLHFQVWYFWHLTNLLLLQPNSPPAPSSIINLWHILSEPILHHLQSLHVHPLPPVTWRWGCPGRQPTGRGSAERQPLLPISSHWGSLKNQPLPEKEERIVFKVVIKWDSLSL